MTLVMLCLLDADDEYTSWRESVIASEQQLAATDGSSTLSKQKSKSLQSISKVSVDAGK